MNRLAEVVPPVMSPEFMRRAERLPASEDADTATAQVTTRMSQHIRASANDPGFQRFARAAVRQFKGGPHFAATGADPLTNPQAVAESAWWWCKTHLEFVHHSRLMREYFGTPNGYQLLIAPNVIVASLASRDRAVRDRGRKGDCAVYSMMLGAMLSACGVPYELVTVAVDPDDPTVYSHVFVYAVMPDGRRLPLDASHGGYPGWSVPMAHRSRTQAWNDQGSPVGDRGPRFGGLHAYMRRGLGVCDESGCYDTTPPSDPFNPSGSTNVGSPPGGWRDTAPVGSMFNWGSLVGNLATQWTQIGGRVIAPQTTYTVGPNGQMSYSTPGAAPIPNVLSSFGGPGSSSLLIYGGLGLAAVLIVGSMGRK